MCLWNLPASDFFIAVGLKMAGWLQHHYTCLIASFQRACISFLPNFDRMTRAFWSSLSDTDFDKCRERYFYSIRGVVWGAIRFPVSIPAFTSSYGDNFNHQVTLYTSSWAYRHKSWCLLKRVARHRITTVLCTHALIERCISFPSRLSIVQRR